MTILIFVNNNQSLILISLSGLSFLFILVQSFYALRSLNTSLIRANYYKRREYFLVKSIYLGANFVKLCFKSSDIEDSKDFSIFLIDLIWTIMEVYWALILFFFCFRIKMGFYEFFEGMLDVDNITHRVYFKPGIVLEIYGLKMKDQPEGVVVEPSFPIIMEKKKVQGSLNDKNNQKVQ